MTAGTSTVIVTGGTRGLGLELALEFARRGHRVLAVYHTDTQAAAKLDAACAAESLPCRAICYDVTADAVGAGLVSTPEVASATSLTLVHNASASFVPTPLHLLTWEDFATNLDVALKGGWQVTRALLRPMLKMGGGTIAGVLTRALSPQPPKGFAAYLAAKAASRALLQSLAAEYGSRGLRVLTVSPPFMLTSLTDKWHPELKESIARLSGSAEPAAVAAKVRALVEDRALPARGENYDV